MKIAVIGGVESTQLLIEKLHQHGFKDVLVFGYHPADVTRVSGWSDLSRTAAVAGYTYHSFRHVDECLKPLEAFKPDRVFAVGLSQLIPEHILSIPPDGFIGFHPTKLPSGRGRAPLAWLILEQMHGAATFFVMTEAVDDGPILAQVPFEVNAADDTSSVMAKLLSAESQALDQFLPSLLHSESLKLVSQDNALATYFGRRTPEDAWLDWSLSSSQLLLLIRSAAHPHPGAYTFCGTSKIVILKALEDNSSSIKGVVGRILAVRADSSFLVQCGEGSLLVREWFSDDGWSPAVGRKLGYYTENEIFKLHSRISILEDQLARLSLLISAPE